MLREITTMYRTSRYPVWVIAALMLTIGSIAGGALMRGSATQAEPAAAAPAVREAATMPATFSPVVKAVLPAVVNISSIRVVRTSSSREDSPFGDLFPGFRMPDRSQRQEG